MRTRPDVKDSGYRNKTHSPRSQLALREVEEMGKK